MSLRCYPQDVSKKFDLKIIPFEDDKKDIFQIDATTKADRVALEGTDGVMLAHAFHMYPLTPISMAGI